MSENIETGKIFVIGSGPGRKEGMTVKALNAVDKCDIVIGYSLYIDLLGDLTAGKEVIRSSMRREKDRCYRAAREAAQGKRVALVSSGDPGIYGMAGLLLQVLEEKSQQVEIEVIPGITAASSAAASLGAPLMNDFAAVSLSDLLTPWAEIEKRLHSAGEGDFVVVLYNPRSKKRKKQLNRAQEILLQYRAETTPVGIVRNSERENEKKQVTTLMEMLDFEIDMSTTIIIGNSRSYQCKDKIITPRGYEL